MHDMISRTFQYNSKIVRKLLNMCLVYESVFSYEAVSSCWLLSERNINCEFKTKRTGKVVPKNVGARTFENSSFCNVLFLNKSEMCL